jgi:acyl-CoA synthetase (AMP-forming)/AMP-acid ligase II
MATRLNKTTSTWLYFGIFLAAVIVVLFAVRSSQDGASKLSNGSANSVSSSTSDDVTTLEKELKDLEMDPVGSDVAEIQQSTQ